MSGTGVSPSGSPTAQQVPVTPQSGFGIGPSQAPQPTAQSAASSAQVAPVGSAAQSQQQATQAAQTPAPLPAALAPTAPSAAPAPMATPPRPGAAGTVSQWDAFYGAHDVNGVNNITGGWQPNQVINTEFQNPGYLNAANPHYNQYMGYNEAFKLPTDISQWESNFGAYGISGNEYKDLFNKLDPYSMYGTKTRTFANNPLMGAFQQSYAPDIAKGLTAEKGAEATQLKAYQAYQAAYQQYVQQQEAYQQELAAQQAAYQQQQAASQGGPLSPLGLNPNGGGGNIVVGGQNPANPYAGPVTEAEQTLSAAQARYNAAMKAPATAYTPGQFSEGGPYGGMGNMIGFTPTPQLAAPSVGAMTGTNPTAGGFGTNGPFNNTVGTGVMYGPPTVPYGSALGGFGGTPASGNDISISASDAGWGGPPAGSEDVSSSVPVTPVAQGPLGDIGPPGNPNQPTFGSYTPDAPVNQNITEGTPAQNLAFDQGFSFLGQIPPSQDFPAGATPQDLGTYQWGAGGPKATKMIGGLGVSPTIAQIAAYMGHPVSANEQSLASMFGINLGTPINLTGNIQAQGKAALGSHYDPAQWGGEGQFLGVPYGDLQAAAKGTQSIFNPNYGIGDILNNPGAVSGQPQQPLSNDTSLPSIDTAPAEQSLPGGAQIGPVLPQAINTLSALYNWLNPTAPLAPPTNPVADFPTLAGQSGVGPQSGNINPTPGLPSTGGVSGTGTGQPPIPPSQAGIIEQLASDYGPVFQAINNNPAIAQPIMQMMEQELGPGATSAQYQSIAEMMANQMLGLGVPLTQQGVTSFLNNQSNGNLWGTPLSRIPQFGSFGGPTQENLVAGLLGLETPTGTGVPTGNYSKTASWPGVAVGQPAKGLGGGVVTQIIPTPYGPEYLGQDLGPGGISGPLNAWRNSVLGL